MKKRGAVLAVVVFASVMMWKFSDHSRTASSFSEADPQSQPSEKIQPDLSPSVQPELYAKSQTMAQAGAPSKSQASTGASFSAFRALVEQSREQDLKCKEDLKAATKGLEGLKTQDPNAVAAELVQGLKEFAKVPLYPKASQQALQMIENGVPSDWDGERLMYESSQLGECASIEHYDTIKNLIEGSSQWSDSLKREVTKTVGDILKNGIDAPMPLLNQLIRIDILNQLQTHGLIDARYAGKIKDLQNESQALKAKVLDRAQGCTSHMDPKCWTGNAYEIANSKPIREHFKALVNEAF